MADRDKLPGATQCLKEIDAWPVDFDQALFAHYPGMKLGAMASVNSYVAPLAGCVKGILATHRHLREWVITAPPFQALPAAANLLCWQIKHALESALPHDTTLELLDLHYLNVESFATSEADFRLRYDYSKNSIEDRVRERSRLRDDIAAHASRLSGRGVIVINDIKVTGVQQQHMTRSFEQVGPGRVEWLYIFSLATELGTRYPEAEHRINSSRLDSLDEYRQVLCSDDTRHTARCVSRLFSLDLADFKDMIHALGPGKSRHLLAQIQAEKRFDGEYFSDKMECLKQCCHSY